MELKDIRDLEKEVVKGMKKSLDVEAASSTKILSDVLLDLRSIEEKLELHPEDYGKKAKKK